MTRIEALSWRQFAAAAASTRIGLVPVGAVEPNGPHMAQGLDNYVAVALADAVAERTGALVAPLVPVGFSARLEGFPGMLNVDPPVVEAYCEGIARCLIDNGLHRILFVCGHGGNTPSLEHVAHRLEAELPGSRLAIVELWKFLQPLSEDLAEGTEYRFGHAGEMPTSLMLHLHPELVDMSQTGLERPACEPDAFGIFRPRPYPLRMPAGALGDTSLATAEKGRVLFGRMADALAAFVTGPDLAGVDTVEPPAATAGPGR
jgi:creatinine amidohydrolase